MTAALIALALAAAAPAASPPLEVLEAGQLDYDVATDRGIVTGGVLLRRGAVMLRADSATYDARTGDVEATGHVLLTEPGRAVAAQAMHTVLDGPFEAHDTVAFLKDTPLDLSRCRSLDEARSTGRNRLTFGGTDAAGTGEQIDVEHARVTLCDCGGGPPSWQIRASHADIVPGKRALLTWPVFYITPRFLFVDTPIPVMVLPALYLPLTDRQTGLLLPVVTFGGPSGLGVSQPLFITLGRSWDATVSFDYLFGPTQRAAEGPGSTLELRWAPAEGARGQLRVSLLHSIVHLWPDGVWQPSGWNRLAVSGFHEQRLSDAAYLKVELGVIGDPLYLVDFTGDALLRGADYRRSAAALTYRSDDVVLGGAAEYLLPQAYLDTGTTSRAPFGPFGWDLSTFHRLPAASVLLLPVGVAGPVRLSGSAGIARFAPLRGVTGDEGRDGVGPGERGWSGAAIDPGERDGAWTPPDAAASSPGERLAATRVAARTELRAPFAVAHAVAVEPWAAATAAGYLFAAGPSPQVDARLAGGLALSTSVGRTFGEGPARFRHEIEPRVEWRGGTAQAGPALPNYAYDELDVALPPRVTTATGDVAAQRTLSAIPGSFSQLQLSVRNRFLAAAGPVSNTFLEVTLGQDLDLAAGKPSETWARAALHLPYVSADAVARFRAFGASVPPGTPPASPPSKLDAFTELSAGVVVSDTRGDNVHANFLALGAGGSPRVLAGLEPFFDPRPVAESAIALGGVGFAARWSGATAGYDALFYGRDLAGDSTGVARCGTGKVISTAPHVYQHQASLVWDSPCRCWKLGVVAILNECDDRPRFSFLVDLSSLGGGGIPR